MSKIEELIEVVRELPDEKVDGLLELARSWAADKAHSHPTIVPIRMGGMAPGWDTPLEDILQARKEAWTFDGDLT